MPHIQRAVEGCNVTNTAQARASQATTNRNCNANNSVQWQWQCAELYEVRLLQSDSPHSAAGCRTSAQQAYFLVECRTSRCPSLVDWRLAPRIDSAHRLPVYGVLSVARHFAASKPRRARSITARSSHRCSWPTTRARLGAPSTRSRRYVTVADQPSITHH